MNTQRKIPVGVSSCLLGEKVRYDGDHQLQPFITRTLGKYFEFRPFCPEVAIGLGVPRPPIRLVATDAGIVCKGSAGQDYTGMLRDCAAQQQGWLQSVCGYIFKQSSPSCGVTGVKVYRGSRFRREGSGIYAQELMRSFPWLPVAEETSFDEPVQRRSFIRRVFVMDRWQQLLATGLTVDGLKEFHARHELLLLSHCRESWRELHSLLAALDDKSLFQLAPEYFSRLMHGLQKVATPDNHIDALLHLQGRLGNVDETQRLELDRAILAWQQGRVELDLPLMLLRQYFSGHPFSEHPPAAVTDCWYLYPDPRELELIGA